MTERVVQTMSQHTAIQVFQRQTPHVHVRVSAWHGMHTAKAAAGPHPRGMRHHLRSHLGTDILVFQP
jgi:hypothetical protein